MRSEKFREINDALKDWFKAALAKNIPISRILMKQKAKEIAHALGIKDFCDSNGWLDKFRVRDNVMYRALCGEIADVDETLCDDWITRLPLLLAGYADKDILNMDETGLFFRPFFAFPNKSMMSADSKEGKQAKERLTIALCTSGTGEKLKPLLM